MGLSIFSYDGGVTLGLQVASALVPDPEAIIAGIEQELAALGRMARARSQARARSSRAPAARRKAGARSRAGKE